MHIVRIALTFILAFCVARARAEALSPGDRAPSLEDATWLSGKPIKSVVPGNVYVVTFFTSTSDQSKETFATISQLASDFMDDAIVVGINVGEKEARAAEQFRTEHANKFKFDIAVDATKADGRGPVATKWLDGIDPETLPVTFVIDQQGKIAYIGEPSDAKAVVSQVVSGDFTAEDARKLRDDEISSEWFKVQAELDRKPLRLQILGDNVAAASEIDALIKKYPRSRPRLLCEQFYCLMRAEKYEEAYGVLDDAARANTRHAMELNELAWFIVSEDWVAQRDLDRAMAMSARSLEIDPLNGAYLDTLARVYFEKGDIDKAYEYQLKAVECATPREVDELLTALDRYKNALPK